MQTWYVIKQIISKARHLNKKMQKLTPIENSQAWNIRRHEDGQGNISHLYNTSNIWQYLI